MKKFIELLTKKIPKIKQDNTFTFILSIVKKNNITNLDQLKTHLNTDIGLRQTWLDENREGPTVNTIRREYAEKLSYLKAALELISNYF